MSTSNPFPIIISPKVDSPEAIAALLQFGQEKKLSAEEINQLIQGLNYLYENIKTCEWEEVGESIQNKNGKAVIINNTNYNNISDIDLFKIIGFNGQNIFTIKNGTNQVVQINGNLVVNYVYGNYIVGNIFGTSNGYLKLEVGPGQDYWLANRRILYNSDLSATYNDRSLVDKGYVAGTYEAKITKNTAFNKNFGTSAGTVAEGNDSRLVNAFNQKVNAISITGDSNKTVTITREDGTTISASFFDNNDPTYPDDVLNTLSFNDNNDGVLRAITSEGEIITVSLDGRYAKLAHTHEITNIIGLLSALNNKENAFGKNTAFNKNFGTSAGTVAEGHKFLQLTGGFLDGPLNTRGIITSGVNGGLDGGIDIKRASDGLSVAKYIIDTSISAAKLSTLYSFLIFETEGIERARFLQGNLGIGTTSPTEKITVSNGKLALTILDSTIGGKIYGYNDNSFNAFSGGLKFETRFFNGSSYVYRDVMTVDSSGNLGIGTTSPSYRLSSHNSSLGRVIVGNFSNDTNAGGTEVGLRLAHSNADVCSVNLISQRTGADAGVDFYIELANSIGIIQERFRINESGNVGIGTTTPTEKLEVNGNGKFSGIVQVSNATANDQAAAFGQVKNDIQTVTSTGTISLTSQNTIVFVDSNSLIDLTLPTIASSVGKKVTFTSQLVGNFKVAVNAANINAILCKGDYTSSYSGNVYCIELINNGTNWVVIRLELFT